MSKSICLNRSSLRNKALRTYVRMKHSYYYIIMILVLNCCSHWNYGRKDLSSKNCTKIGDDDKDSFQLLKCCCTFVLLFDNFKISLLRNGMFEKIYNFVPTSRQCCISISTIIIIIMPCLK